MLDNRNKAPFDIRCREVPISNGRRQTMAKLNIALPDAMKEWVEDQT